MFVIVDGSGRFQFAGKTYKMGATPVDDGDPIVDHIRSGKAPSWVSVAETREATLPAAPEVADEEPDPRDAYERFKGRDGQWYFWAPASAVSGAGQRGPFDTEEALEAAIDEHQAEANRVPLASEVQTSAVGEPLAPAAGADGFSSEDVAAMRGEPIVCRAEGCGRDDFRTIQARTNHERSLHPELFRHE